MPTMRELKKRLQSVTTTRQLAGAMRTVSTAKYSRISAQLGRTSAYAEACGSLAAELDIADLTAEKGLKAFRGAAEKTVFAPPGSRIYLLISGNRGLCGGYNHELFNFFYDEVLSEYPQAEYAVCGRMAAEYFASKGVEPIEVFEASDVPTYEEAEAIADKLYGYYAAGRAESVYFVYQGFISMMKQTPEIRRFLPAEQGDAQSEGEDSPAPSDTPIFIPDEETVRQGLMRHCLDSQMHTLLLQCAAGAQAATLMAMRSAYDNASESCQQLETAINRRRQAEVTQSVLETSADQGFDRRGN